MPGTIEETLNAFTTYLHFVKDDDFECMYADLRMALHHNQIDPMEFRARILDYIKKIVEELPCSVADKAVFFTRYRRRLQRTADALEKEFSNSPCDPSGP